jgi:hypothetical protein
MQHRRNPRDFYYNRPQRADSPFSFIQNRPVMAGAIAVGVLLFLSSIPDMMRNAQQFGETKERFAQQSALVSRSNADAEIAKMRAKIAESRYQSGLLFVVLLKDTDQFSAIKEGETVVDWASKRPLTDGTVVGDVNGNTGVINGGVVTDVAFTGDRGIVEAAMRRARVQGKSTSSGNK